MISLLQFICSIFAFYEFTTGCVLTSFFILFLHTSITLLKSWSHQHFTLNCVFKTHHSIFKVFLFGANKCIILFYHIIIFSIRCSKYQWIWCNQMVLLIPDPLASYILKLLYNYSPFADKWIHNHTALQWRRSWSGWSGFGRTTFSQGNNKIPFYNKWIS